MSIPKDYAERVYAGVLGKIIGVYLGRPFEGWDYDKLTERFGQIDAYVHEKLGTPLIVTDDDISGTFTFIRALEDYGVGADIEPWMIGQTWLNYIIERRTVLWWGGMGVSTEQTAFERLKSGIAAPRSGSIDLNSRTVAEQIGAQIFIDGWAMIAPGDPELASDLARRAGSVSHDGAAVHAAQVIAALESLAFVERDIDTLLDRATALIPRDSIIRAIIEDIRGWHGADHRDWRSAFLKVRAKYGYDSYGGGCHVVPNHAVIILAILYGDGDFSRSLMIANTCGWDTDCNSGNVGCLMGIRNGLAGIDDSKYDWRGPVGDRLYLPTADGGRAISDAGSEAIRIVNMGRKLQGNPPVEPKAGARFHFDLPGLVQGWSVAAGGAMLENVAGHSSYGARSLAIRLSQESTEPVRLATPTFTPPDLVPIARRPYEMVACPTLYPGHSVCARLTSDSACEGAIEAKLLIEHYNAEDGLSIVYGPACSLSGPGPLDLEWVVPDVGGQPIARVGIELSTGGAAVSDTVYLDYLTWSGTPKYSARRVEHGKVWPLSWVDAVDQFDSNSWESNMRIVQNSGKGILIQGAREWTDYRVTAGLKCHLAEGFGLAVRVQGLKRYYALMLSRPDRVCLIKECDGTLILAESELKWMFDARYEVSLRVEGDRIQASVDGKSIFDMRDRNRPLEGGAIGVIVEGGNVFFSEAAISPADAS